MELNKPISNPMLIGAIQVMKADPSQEHKNMFIDEMLKAKFLSPVIITPKPEKDENGKVTLSPTNKFQFPMLTSQENTHYFMAFTDRMELKKSEKEDSDKNACILTIEDYMGMILQKDCDAAGFVINPFGENIIVPREMLVALAINQMKVAGRPVSAPTQPVRINPALKKKQEAASNSEE